MLEVSWARASTRYFADVDARDQQPADGQRLQHDRLAAAADDIDVDADPGRGHLLLVELWVTARLCVLIVEVRSRAPQVRTGADAFDAAAHVVDEPIDGARDTARLLGRPREPADEADGDERQEPGPAAYPPPAVMVARRRRFERVPGNVAGGRGRRQRGGSGQCGGGGWPQAMEALPVPARLRAARNSPDPHPCIGVGSDEIHCTSG